MTEEERNGRNDVRHFTEKAEIMFNPPTQHQHASTYFDEVASSQRDEDRNHDDDDDDDDENPHDGLHRADHSAWKNFPHRHTFFHYYNGAFSSFRSRRALRKRRSSR